LNNVTYLEAFMGFSLKQNGIYKTILDKAKEEPRLGLHSFHRYYGKLIPAIPRAFIKEFTKQGDLIFDPFSGSGTTALEAKYLNRDFLGIEVNPLSVLISKAKTNNYSLEALEDLYSYFAKNLVKEDSLIKETDIPFVVNRDHWFKDYVQRDLILLKRVALKAISEIHNISNSKAYKQLIDGTISAVVKSVSNADTRHVFPGFSKRMRALEELGKNEKNVFQTFLRAFKKRIKQISEVGNHNVSTEIIEADSSNFNANKYKNTVDLVVTNPPYISSVRYAETLKLELYWMEVIKNQNDYSDLSSKIIGNDKISKDLYLKKHSTKYDFINKIIDDMFVIDPKNARIIFDFFQLMEKVIDNIYIVLKPGKRLVMKISDSKIRKTNIETGYLLTKIAETKGFRLIDVFSDKIDQNSRSLTTARNTYSDIILADYIIIWEKM
jgi:DNA modification methylase